MVKTDVIYQSVQQAFTHFRLDKTISENIRKLPAHAGKLAVEAVDDGARGEGAPSPIYEGEDSVIAYVLSGPDKEYSVPLPNVKEPKRAILENYARAFSGISIPSFD